MSKGKNCPIAAFISPHGFGHAARAAAILEVVQEKSPATPLKLFTTVPEHFFRENLTGFTLSRVQSDVGIVQHDALNCDVERTREALDRFLPFPGEHIDELAGQVADSSAVLCDISPLGIAVAERAGIPSILVENFTWDWIYHQHPLLANHREQMSDIFARATCHIQTEPVCLQRRGTVECPPIFRKMREDKETVKKKIGADSRPVILISMGGIGYRLNDLTVFEKHNEMQFILAGADRNGTIGSNVTGLSLASDIYHPDLINAADIVVCKAGYSTVAESLQAGTSMICVDRKGFAETSVLSRFVAERLNGTIIDETEFNSGEWLKLLPEILEKPSPEPATVNGAEKAAEILLSLSHQTFQG